jgi:DNA-binding MarR family transcriptional regulator
MLEPSSNITRLVDKLEQKKLVSRCENKDNRRMQELRITEEGLELLHQIGLVMDDLEIIFKGISEMDAKTANDVLDAIRS